MVRWLVRLLVLAGLAYAAWKAWQMLAGDDEDHSDEWASTLRPRGQAGAGAPAATATAAAATATAAATAAAREAADEPAGDDGARDDGPSANGADATTWVKPDGSRCPAGYPVKAKTGSRVYRVPGMFSYADSKPERCYCDEDAAVTDGFTRAKR
jgi:hypothetical protein